MPRLDFIEESEKTPAARALIEMAQQRGAPDWRVASIMARNPTVRSNVARAEGLSEALVAELNDYAASDKFTAREKAALRYADLFKAGEHAIDRDDVYRELKRHFSDAEIIELGMMCAQTDGVGRFVKSLNIVSWAEACEANPALARTAS